MFVNHVYTIVTPLLHCLLGAMGMSHDSAQGAQGMMAQMPGQVEYNNMPYSASTDYQGANGGEAPHGAEMMQQSMHRGPPMPGNPSIGGYQLPFTQGRHLLFFPFAQFDFYVNCCFVHSIYQVCQWQV